MKYTCLLFKAAVQEGGTWSIMGSYNLYQGQHACHNKRLLKDILRDEWGFDGVVVSDWGGCAQHRTGYSQWHGLGVWFMDERTVCRNEKCV